jgi:uncharacterized membrane protein (DUF106 family)
MSVLATVISWINMLSNFLGRFCLAPIAVLPGWLSIAIISAVTGLFFLIVFKYTSNQRAIGRVKDDMKAQMLAIKLFKDSLSVTLMAQCRLFKGALLLLVNAIVPMLVMILPMSLLLTQMALWYQYRPLLPQEHAVLTVELNGNIDESWQIVNLEYIPSFVETLGPVRILSKRQICWEIKALRNGYHRIMNPAETPLRSDSVVRSISIDYPDRPATMTGANWWLAYFFLASIAFAFILKPLVKVRL